MKTYYVYILSNCRRTVYYVGITNQLERRAIEHKYKKDKNSFTAKYNINELLYYEKYDNSIYAIQREKQIKSWRREKKINLIKKLNPEIKNLFVD
ncbi:MAG: endonuclease [Candidatus Magasanikbacteria bacterium CG_4_9_14_3_um_filter_32_9]|uniref:Endonuclease n=1 Tax=Candidatus Magasanikbacteria bacterium CG_4_9_14_3_um_filter_32_9 TaxID=1974644 RepID=A0A2M7Z6I1_9BACT|nr:MAG: endonuclease [Candidatus Magasanikbacteria bacterium CG_4_9_14_3_um_filter_32_9]